MAAWALFLSGCTSLHRPSRLGMITSALALPAPDDVDEGSIWVNVAAPGLGAHAEQLREEVYAHLEPLYHPAATPARAHYQLSLQAQFEDEPRAEENALAEAMSVFRSRRRLDAIVDLELRQRTTQVGLAEARLRIDGARRPAELIDLPPTIAYRARVAIRSELWGSETTDARIDPAARQQQRFRRLDRDVHRWLLGGIDHEQLLVAGVSYVSDLVNVPTAPIALSDRDVSARLVAARRTLLGAGTTSELTHAIRQVEEVLAASATGADDGALSAASLRSRLIESLDALDGARNDTIERVPRFCALTTPTHVQRTQTFNVRFAVTTTSLGEPPSVTIGDIDEDGRLALMLGSDAAEATEWQLDVELCADGCIIEPRRVQQLTLRREDHSTAVSFGVTVAARDVAAVALRLNLWQGGRLLGQLSRKVEVVSPSTSEPSQLAASDRQARPGRWMFLAAAAARPPDLTLVVERRGDQRHFRVWSPHFATPADEQLPAAPIDAWLRAQLPRIMQRGRGRDDDEAPAGSELDLIKGFGDELWQRVVPEVFRRRFCELSRRDDVSFESVAIYTDEPQVPWEMMRPRVADEAGEFLGVTHRVGRWHLDPTDTDRPSPRRALVLENLSVLAPNYAEERGLPSQSAEVAFLATLPGFRRVAANRRGLRELLDAPPRGIVHFAGHGELVQDADATRVCLVLDNGPVNATELRGMARRRLREGVFFFLNACELAREDVGIGFVDGWAPALLELGGSGCLAAISPVGDENAAAFARAFYQQLLSAARGDGTATAADAVRRARRELLAQGHATGLRFVLYGDPDLAIELPGR